MGTKLLYTVAFLVSCLVIPGCSRPADTGWIFNRYDLTDLKISTSADVLTYLGDPAAELVSHSDSVIASYGETAKGTVLWFNIVAFDEESLTAARKYALLADEKLRRHYIKKSQKLRFDAEVVVDLEVLDAPYANENEKRIAILQNVSENFQKDVTHIARDSRDIESMTLLARQTLEGIVRTLKNSPARAVRLSEPAGLEFDQMNFGTGKIRMLLEDDIVRIKIKLGALMKGFENQPDVIYM